MRDFNHTLRQLRPLLLVPAAALLSAASVGENAPELMHEPYALGLVALFIVAATLLLALRRPTSGAKFGIMSVALVAVVAIVFGGFLLVRDDAIEVRGTKSTLPQDHSLPARMSKDGSDLR